MEEQGHVPGMRQVPALAKIKKTTVENLTINWLPERLDAGKRPGRQAMPIRNDDRTNR
jgi:hypothetical protein